MRYVLDVLADKLIVGCEAWYNKKSEIPDIDVEVGRAAAALPAGLSSDDKVDNKVDQVRTISKLLLGISNLKNHFSNTHTLFGYFVAILLLLLPVLASNIQHPDLTKLTAVLIGTSTSSDLLLPTEVLQLQMRSAVNTVTLLPDFYRIFVSDSSTSTLNSNLSLAGMGSMCHGLSVRVLCLSLVLMAESVTRGYDGVSSDAAGSQVLCLGCCLVQLWRVSLAGWEDSYGEAEAAAAVANT